MDWLDCAACMVMRSTSSGCVQDVAAKHAMREKAQRWAEELPAADDEDEEEDDEAEG